MRTNLIPLAGKGQRFVDEGYLDPKPLIEVNGVPMLIAAVSSLPEADHNVFVCLNEHIDTYELDKKIKRYYKAADIISTESITEGQSSTCMLAEDYIDPDSILTIGSCDNGMLYKEEHFKKIISDLNTDAVIWTFRHNPNVLVHPDHWGWVKVNNKGYVEKVSVKIPVSDDPINDHAVVGCFSFKRAKYFFDNARKMISSNRRIKNEFYNDECMNVLIENGLRVKVFEIDKYIGWGTPNDLKTYLYWQQYFQITRE
jgi:dTDP-glucose pyrophosphorylase